MSGQEQKRPRINPVKAHINAITAAVNRLLKPPITIMFPDYEEAWPEGFRGFILLDYDKCIGCSLCAQICPARAIKMYTVPEDKRPRPGYNVGRCIFCGLCVDVCPTDALRHSFVHDEVYSEVAAMDMDPIDWALWSKKIGEKERTPRPRLKPVVDEEVGLRYVEVEEDSGGGN